MGRKPGGRDRRRAGGSMTGGVGQSRGSHVRFSGARDNAPALYYHILIVLVKKNAPTHRTAGRKWGKQTQSAGAFSGTGMCCLSDTS
jgi:hypothetical protein